jgi:hypothetical protein
MPTDHFIGHWLFAGLMGLVFGAYIGRSIGASKRPLLYLLIMTAAVSLAGALSQEIGYATSSPGVRGWKFSKQQWAEWQQLSSDQRSDHRLEFAAAAGAAAFVAGFVAARYFPADNSE